MMNVIRVITTYVEGNESFKICEGFIEETRRKVICAINVKYIENGKLTKALNGADMNVSDTVEECINRVHTSLEIKRFEAMGYNPFTAVLLAHGYSEDEAIEKGNRMMDMM